MKNIIFKLLTISFVILQSCSPESDSNTNNTTSGSVDYEFTVIFDGIIYKVKGTTSKDANYSGPTINNCIAKEAKFIGLSIKDVTNYNYVSGKPIICNLFSYSNFTFGTNFMEMTLSFNGGFYDTYYKNQGACPGCNGGGDNRLPIIITDLGTPIAGVIGNSNVIFGNTIKGRYNGVVYSVPAGSNKATTPHNLSIDFKAVRQY